MELTGIFDIITAVNMKTCVIWDVTQFNLVGKF
jgi:hypothetical protein